MILWCVLHQLYVMHFIQVSQYLQYALPFMERNREKGMNMNTLSSKILLRTLSYNYDH